MWWRTAPPLPHARRREASRSRQIWVHSKWLWVKERYSKWSTGKWNQGLKPAVPWWFSFDLQPNGWMHMLVPQALVAIILVACCFSFSTNRGVLEPLANFHVGNRVVGFCGTKRGWLHFGRLRIPSSNTAIYQCVVVMEATRASTETLQTLACHVLGLNAWPSRIECSCYLPLNLRNLHRVARHQRDAPERSPIWVCLTTTKRAPSSQDTSML